MIVFGPRGAPKPALALDPEAMTWRELPAAPFGALAGAVWTGEAVVIASRGATELSPDTVISASTYDPTGDCWTRLPDVPGRPNLRALHTAGDRVLAVTGGEDSSQTLAISILDPATRTWTAASPAPLLDDGGAGIWTGTELVFLTRERNSDDSVYNAAYSPSTDTWRLIEPTCEVWEHGAVWTGRYIVTQTRWAVDPLSGQCVRIPRRRERVATDPLRIWTGREVIEWSGHDGDDQTALPEGFEYRPRE